MSITTSSVEGTGALSRAIGRRVRSARSDAGWTLDQLAHRSGVSRRLLVTVEQGEANPSIATLLRISDALGVGLPSLVDTAADIDGAVAVNRADELRPMWTSSAGGSAVMVAGTAPPDVTELWDWRLGPGDTYQSEGHRAGTRELMLVLSGAVELIVGDTHQRLGAGDSARFDGGIDHAYRNASRTRAARFALTVFEPTAQSGAKRHD